nr:vegetative incompatibility protein het-e-1 [Quercus suber]
MLLSQLARLEIITSLRLRIFVTSRPELPIKLGFTDIRTSLHLDIMLEEVQATTIEQDIRTYFRHRLEERRSEDSAKQPYDPLAIGWPGEVSISALVDLAVPLFIFASTVCRYIGESDPRERLESILLQQQQGRNMPLSGLAKTYLPILNQLTTEDTLAQHDQIIAEFKEIVGSIVLLANPLSASSLGNLLDIRLRVIGRSISKLHSVLNIPVDHNAPIRLFHLSFHDLLIGVETKDHNKFWISEVDTHRMLARKCLTLLGKPGILRKDLCGIQEPGRQRHEVGQQVVTASIASDTAYACSYWVWHLAGGQGSIIDDGDEHVFLKTHFLYWMEALSWLGRLSEMIDHIAKLRSLVVVERGSKLLLFLDDTKRFVLRNRHVVNLAPLQLYSSALIFAPNQSIVRRTFEEQHSIPWLTQLPKVPLTWNAEVQKLEGHSRAVSAVAFSPNGRVLASASFDMTVRLWDAISGEAIQILEAHEGKVNDVVFSPDGAVLASASYDTTVQLWNATSGEEMSMLEGHDEQVNAVAFSPDGAVLASASDDRTVRLWDAKTGEALHTLEGHDKQVHDVAFSSDGVMLASLSAHTTVRLWNVKTCEVIRTLVGHHDQVRAVAFSPDSQMLASSSWDRTLRLWTVETGMEIQKLVENADRISTLAFSHNGQVLASTVDNRVVWLYNVATCKAIQKLEGHDHGINAVVFSPDSQVLASAAWDRTVRLWNTTAGEAMPKAEGHSSWISAVTFSSDGQTRCIRVLGQHVAFSPDDCVLASAANDRTVRLWDAKTGAAMQKLQAHVDQVNAIAFSPDGDMLASSSDDRTVWLWDAKTGEAIHKFVGHDDPVIDMAFSPNGQMLASASKDRTVRL